MCFDSHLHLAAHVECVVSHVERHFRKHARTICTYMLFNANRVQPMIVERCLMCSTYRLHVQEHPRVNHQAKLWYCLIVYLHICNSAAASFIAQFSQCHRLLRIMETILGRLTLVCVHMHASSAARKKNMYINMITWYRDHTRIHLKANWYINSFRAPRPRCVYNVFSCIVLFGKRHEKRISICWRQPRK